MHNDSKYYTLKGDNIYLKKVENLLFILASNYSIIDNKLNFTLEMKLQNQQIRLLLEKCLNCVERGVCTVLCPVSALYLDDSKTIKVNKDLCVGWLACCKQIDSKLKMGCIARNYKKERLSIVF